MIEKTPKVGNLVLKWPIFNNTVNMKIFKLCDKWKKNHFTLFLIKFYGSTLIFSHLWSTSAEFYDFEKNPFRQICPLRAFFRSSQFELFFFELPLHHQFWSDIQNLCDMHTSWPRGFHRMLWMVPRFIRLGGVTPPKYMELFFWDGGSIFKQLVMS